MDEPLQLVRVCGGGRFEVVEDTARLISSIDDPLAVLCIVGLYRTGKSFLLNQLLGHRITKGSGFPVGPTIKPCTKGLWIYSHLPSLSSLRPPSTSSESIRLLTLDTEGLGSFSANETQDAKLFSLGLLLSSFFVYNSMGMIDDNAITRLGVVSELTQWISSKSGSIGDIPSRITPPRLRRRRLDVDLNQSLNLRSVSVFFPTFLWVVRDFVLELRDGGDEEGGQGKVLSEDDYLELALRSHPVKPTQPPEEGEGAVPPIGQSQYTDSQRNKDLLREFFPDRHCRTLVRPVLNESDLRDIRSSLPSHSSSLRPEFRSQIVALKKFIFERIQPKRLGSDRDGSGGLVLTGRSFVSLLKSYVGALNSGGIVVERCWGNVVRGEFEEAFVEARRYYRRRMHGFLERGSIVSLERFESVNAEIVEVCLERFCRIAGDLDLDLDLEEVSLVGDLDSDERRSSHGPGAGAGAAGGDLLGGKKDEYCRRLRKTLRREYLSLRTGLRKASHQYCVQIVNERLRPMEQRIAESKYPQYAVFESDLKSLISEYREAAKGSEGETVLLATLIKWGIPSSRAIHEFVVGKLRRSAQEAQRVLQEDHIEALDQLRREFASEKQQLEMRIDRAEEAREMSGRTLEDARETLSELQGQIEQKSHRMDDLSEHLRDREERIRGLIQEKETVESKLEQSVSVLRELKTEHRKLTSQMESEKSSIYSLKMEYDSVQIENASLKQTIEFLDQKNEQLTKNVTDYCNELTDLKFRFEEREKQSASTEARTRAQLERAKSFESQVVLLKKKVGSLQAKLTSVRDLLREKESRLREKDVELMNTASRLKSFQRRAQLEKEKAAENADRLKMSLRDRERLLSSEKMVALEKQVEQLNATNRRILEINKKVMDENKILREEVIAHGGSIRTALLLSPNRSFLADFVKTTQSPVYATPSTKKYHGSPTSSVDKMKLDSDDHLGLDFPILDGERKRRRVERADAGAYRPAPRKPSITPLRPVAPVESSETRRSHDSVKVTDVPDVVPSSSSRYDASETNRLDEDDLDSFHDFEQVIQRTRRYNHDVAAAVAAADRRSRRPSTSDSSRPSRKRTIRVRETGRSSEEAPHRRHPGRSAGRRQKRLQRQQQQAESGRFEVTSSMKSLSRLKRGRKTTTRRGDY